MEDTTSLYANLLASSSDAGTVTHVTVFMSSTHHHLKVVTETKPPLSLLWSEASVISMHTPISTMALI